MALRIVLWEMATEWWRSEDWARRDSIVQLLNAIRSKHNIDFEVIEKFDEKELYADVFLKHRNILGKNTGKGGTEKGGREGA